MIMVSYKMLYTTDYINMEWFVTQGRKPAEAGKHDANIFKQQKLLH